MRLPDWQGAAGKAAQQMDDTSLKPVRHVLVSPRMYQELGDSVFPILKGKLSFCGKDAKLDASIRSIQIVRVD